MRRENNFHSLIENGKKLLKGRKRSPRDKLAGILKAGTLKKIFIYACKIRGIWKKILLSDNSSLKCDLVRTKKKNINQEILQSNSLYFVHLVVLR